MGCFRTGIRYVVVVVVVYDDDDNDGDDDALAIDVNAFVSFAIIFCRQMPRPFSRCVMVLVLISLFIYCTMFSAASVSTISRSIPRCLINTNSLLSAHLVYIWMAYVEVGGSVAVCERGTASGVRDRAESE